MGRKKSTNRKQKQSANLRRVHASGAGTSGVNNNNNNVRQTRAQANAIRNLVQQNGPDTEQAVVLPVVVQNQNVQHDMQNENVQQAQPEIVWPAHGSSHLELVE